MNKKILKLALIGLAAGFCLSVQASPTSNNQDEVAMAKCTKDGSGNPSRSGSSCSSCDGKSSNGSCNTGSCKPNKSSLKQKRSAAQKVVQGN